MNWLIFSIKLLRHDRNICWHSILWIFIVSFYRDSTSQFARLIFSYNSFFASFFLDFQIVNVCSIYIGYASNSDVVDFESLLHTAVHLCGQQMHLVSRSLFLGNTLLLLDC
jgi:hypothetical protein